MAAQPDAGVHPDPVAEVFPLGEGVSATTASLGQQVCTQSENNIARLPSA
ncbi:MAG TPA: hypothetical protein VMU34_18170 [Mycobacterium sp.]|nr:hypothetical protein [Mycobacterium sp.]